MHNQSSEDLNIQLQRYQALLRQFQDAQNITTDQEAKTYYKNIQSVIYNQMGFVLACVADYTAHADTKHQIYQEALAQFEAAETIAIDKEYKTYYITNRSVVYNKMGAALALDGDSEVDASIKKAKYQKALTKFSEAETVVIDKECKGRYITNKSVVYNKMGSALVCDGDKELDVNIRREKYQQALTQFSEAESSTTDQEYKNLYNHNKSVVYNKMGATLALEGDAEVDASIKMAKYQEAVAKFSEAEAIAIDEADQTFYHHNKSVVYNKMGLALALGVEGDAPTDIITTMQKYEAALTQFRKAEANATTGADQILYNHNKSVVYNKMASALALEGDAATDITTTMRKYEESLKYLEQAGRIATTGEYKKLYNNNKSIVYNKMVYSLVLEGYSATDIIVTMRKYGEALTQFSSAESRVPNQEDQALCNSNKSGVYDEMDSASVLERDTAADINTKQQKYNIPPKLHALPPELTINKEVNKAIAIVRNSMIYKVNIELESIRHKINENLEKTFRIHAEIANINIDSTSLEDSEANISKLKSLIENISIIKASIMLDQGAYRVYASIVEDYLDLSENNNTIYIEGLEQKAETTREECNNKLHLITESLKRKADSLEKSIKAPLEIMVQEELELKEYIQNFYWQLQTMEETREYFEAQKLELRKFINDIEEYNKIVTILHQNSIEYNSYSLIDAKHVPEAIMLCWDEKQQELMELHHMQAEIAQNISNEISGEQVNTQQEDGHKWDWLLMGNHQEHLG